MSIWQHPVPLLTCQIQYHIQINLLTIIQHQHLLLHLICQKQYHIQIHLHTPNMHQDPLPFSACQEKYHIQINHHLPPISTFQRSQIYHQITSIHHLQILYLKVQKHLFHPQLFLQIFRHSFLTLLFMHQILHSLPQQTTPRGSLFYKVHHFQQNKYQESTAVDNHH